MSDYLHKPLPIHKLVFGKSFSNISKTGYLGPAFGYKNVLKRPFSNKMRKMDIDLLLGKPLWIDSIVKDTFKSLHTYSITDQLWRISNYGQYGIGAWHGVGASLASSVHLINSDDVNIALARNRPKGRFYIDRGIIYPGFKYHCMEDYDGIKEISDFENEDKDIKSLSLK